MVKPVVTILTPTYNQESYIEKCINSVLSQTFENWEMIIIDDGSTDRTVEKIQEFSDKRIKLIRQENVGIWKLAETYKKGLDSSSGEFIAILDGDDWWPENKLEIQRTGFKRDNIVLSFGTAINTDISENIIYRKKTPSNLMGEISSEKMIKVMLKQFFFPWSVTVMLRRSAISGLRFVQPDYLPLVDIPTWLTILKNGDAYGFPDLLGYYRVIGSSVCRQNSQVIQDGHSRFASSYLKNSWQELKFTEKEKQALLSEIQAVKLYNDSMGYLYDGKWKNAFSGFIKTFSGGDSRTRMKSAIRLIQLLFSTVAGSK